MATIAAARFSEDLPMCSPVLINTANPNRDGTGALTLLFIPGSLGARVHWVKICAQAVTTPGMIRLFVGPSPGVGAMLVAEIPVPAVVPSGTDPAFAFDWFPPFNFASQQAELLLFSAYNLYVSTQNGEPFAVTAFGARM